MGRVVAKAKQDDTMVEFRVAMTLTSTCTHKGPIFHCKARQMCADSGSDTV